MLRTPNAGQNMLFFKKKKRSKMCFRNTSCPSLNRQKDGYIFGALYLLQTLSGKMCVSLKILGKLSGNILQQKQFFGWVGHMGEGFLFENNCRTYNFLKKFISNTSNFKIINGLTFLTSQKLISRKGPQIGMADGSACWGM